MRQPQHQQTRLSRGGCRQFSCMGRRGSCSVGGLGRGAEGQRGLEQHHDERRGNLCSFNAIGHGAAAKVHAEELGANARDVAPSAGLPETSLPPTSSGS